MPGVRTELWTDGSGTASGPIGWAWVLRAINQATGELLAEKRGTGCFPDGTANRAELMAVIEGLLALNKPASITVFSDSEYVVKTVSNGTLALWQGNGWKLSRRKPDAPDRGPAECPRCGRTGEWRETCTRHDPPSDLNMDYNPRLVRNRDLWQMIVGAAGLHHLTFEHVPGHAGHELNEKCDRLAGEARRALIATAA